MMSAHTQSENLWNHFASIAAVDITKFKVNLSSLTPHSAGQVVIMEVEMKGDLH